MKPEQVTDEMYEEYRWNRLDWRTPANQRLESCQGIAAALTAMPDDLLRELARERGCVLVPRDVLDELLDAGHLYAGECPDPTQPDARDSQCPACRAMLATAASSEREGHRE